MSFPRDAAVYESKHGLKIERLQTDIGAEISGVDLRQPLTSAIADDLREALNDHGVIFFRNQDIDPQAQLALTALWGTPNNEGPDPARPEFRPVRPQGGAKDQSAARWHSDSMHLECPPRVSILRSYQSSILGGDTAFASATAAYAGLPDDVKARIDDMTFRTSAAFVHARGLAKGKAMFSSVEKHKEIDAKNPPRNHPVVLAHPDTHQPVLWINSVYVEYINGMSHFESADLARYLCDEFKRPEYQCRWRWTDHSIAVWDNRAVQHYGVPNQLTDRYLERTMAAGDKPLAYAEWRRMQAEKAA